MIDIIKQWALETNEQFIDKRIPCSTLPNEVTRHFNSDFLQNSYFVIVPQIPLPKEAAHFITGHDTFAKFAGLTLDDTYYLLPSVSGDLAVHFHELVHVAQWKHLGFDQFINRYIYELEHDHYKHMSLEKMAYALQTEFSKGICMYDASCRIKNLLS